MKFKFLLIITTLFLVITSSQSAFALVNVGVKVPVWMKLSDSDLTKRGYAPGFGLHVQIPFSAFAIGYEYYAPKIRYKPLYDAMHHTTVHGATSDGKITYHLFNVLAVLPIPVVVLRLGGGVGLASISNIGFSGNTIIKDNKYKAATVYDLAIEAGVPIATIASLDVGYRYIGGTFKTEHDDPILKSFKAGASVFNVGITVGF